MRGRRARSDWIAPKAAASFRCLRDPRCGSATRSHDRGSGRTDSRRWPSGVVAGRSVGRITHQDAGHFTRHGADGVLPAGFVRRRRCRLALEERRDGRIAAQRAVRIRARCNRAAGRRHPSLTPPISQRIGGQVLGYVERLAVQDLHLRQVRVHRVRIRGEIDDLPQLGFAFLRAIRNNKSSGR